MQPRYYALTLSLSLLFCANAKAAGFQQTQIDFPGTKALPVGIWYPSTQALPTKPNAEFGMAMALDAPIENSNGGLIVISHGFSGWYAGHAKLATALAEAGFIVAAPSHSGNTWSDMSSPINKWSLDRPAQISRVIDYVLDESDLGQHVNPEHIGIYGFSAGGYTALNLIGGTPDFARAERVCQTDPAEFVCDEGMVSAMLEADMDTLPAERWGYDSRIKAAAIAAPGFGFAYTEQSLSKVNATVQLWSAEFDHSVPSASNADWLATQLPTKPDYRIVEGANHFAFLIMPCRDEFKQADPEEYEMVCGDADGFNRLEFQTQLRSDLVDFFRTEFGLQ